MLVNTKLLPWLIPDWQQLNRYAKQNRIPQALLISGTRGIGKAMLAREFAHSLLCSNRTHEGFCCGVCHYCVLVNSGSHPDLLEITPEDDKKTISINQIRSIITDTYLKPQFDQQRVIIIKPADMLTISAANAFLKCLEEPTERTSFILITDKPNKLPATIASRCQKIVITPPTAETLNLWMQTNNALVNKLNLANLLKGSVLSHQQLTDEIILKQRDECFNGWLSLAVHKSFPVEICEKWDKVPKIELFDWLASWIADIIKCTYVSNSNHLYNQDFSEHLQKFSQQLELQGLYGLYDRILICRQYIGMQLNFQVMLEEILVHWQELNRRKSHG